MAAAAATAAPFSTPVFEGSEKRIEIDFLPAAGVPSVANGLRSVGRAQLDEILDLAACCIVSARHGPAFDAYVLSESSLFVYPRKAILKTCGTTRLLAAVPALIEAAAAVGLEPARAKYSRASFLFPEQQPAMHASFPEETSLLQSAFATMGGISGAYVLGDTLRGLQWHVFVAQTATAIAEHKPAYTLEVCMTGLHPEKAAQFARGPDFVSAEATTDASGIRALLPAAKIDDYVFEPCGYSMNGMDGAQASTIHITPETGFSYASVEVFCQNNDEIDTGSMVARIADIFRPAELVVVASVDGGDVAAWGAALSPPAGFSTACRTVQDLRCGGRVTFLSLSANAGGTAAGAFADAHVVRACDIAASSEPVPRPPSPALCPPVPPPHEGLPTAYSSDSEGTFGSDSGDAADEAVADLVPEMAADAAATAAAEAPATFEPAAFERPIKPPPLVALGAAFEAPAMPSAAASAATCSEAAAAVMAKHGAAPLLAVDPTALDAHISALIEARRLDDTFYVMDLGIVAALAAAWTRLMPRVRPFYAVKCNGDPALLEVLAASGACFDCASEAEITAVLGCGVGPERIIFANACKRPSDIRAAKASGVHMTTADSESELFKIAALDPGAQVLLRIRQDDPSARCQLGNKYGAEEHDIDGLLTVAKDLDLDLAGVSFHVGSGASNPDALPEGIAAAAAVFDRAAALGFNMRVLDIGGGFPGGEINAAGNVDLGRVPIAVNAALAAHFPPERGVDIIAEPGRFFAESCATLVCQVFGRRCRTAPPAAAATAVAPSLSPAAATSASLEPSVFDYYITDGLYGSFNCIMYDHAQPTARPLRSPTLPSKGADRADNEGLFPSTVFGPSCDGLDTVFQSIALPELRNGDWLAFPAMGAYTLCGASDFNGIAASRVPTFYVQSTLTAAAGSE